MPPMRYVFIGLADEVTVDHGGVIRPLAHDPAGGEGIGFPPVLGDGIVIHHGIHVAPGHQKAQPGTAVYVDGLGIFPVRLGNDAYGVAVGLQHPADDGMAEGGMVHVGIPDHIYKVAPVPTPVQHILSAKGKKFQILVLRSVFSLL